MHVIAIVNQKGGCGKTTTAINLAATLGRQDKRVLLIDMDSQGHASLGLGVPGNESPGLYEVFNGECAITDVIQVGAATGVDLVPGTISLAATDKLLADHPQRDRQLLECLKSVRNGYHYVILDCPPALGLLSINALRASDLVLIPVDVSLFAMDGIERLRETIRMLEHQYQLKTRAALLANMFDNRTRLAREVLDMLESQIPVELCHSRIRNTVRVREAVFRGMPLTDFAPRSAVSRDFHRLAHEILERLPANETLDEVAITAVEADSLEGAPVDFTEDDLREVVFRFDEHGHRKIQIAGEFNDWTPDKGVETKNQDGALQKILRVPPGGYEYRLVIDGVWQADPDNPEVVSNQFGDNNSVLHT